MKHAPHPWASNPAQLYAEAWLRLTRGVHDRPGPASDIGDCQPGRQAAGQNGRAARG